MNITVSVNMNINNNNNININIMNINNILMFRHEQNYTNTNAKKLFHQTRTK
jgi:hypothetical protein